MQNINLNEYDLELSKIINDEKIRQEEHIELIASENYASLAVMQAQGSYLTNKYAEGYPHKRYYGGCAYVDKSEELAIKRVKKLFGADYANVQPHSGSQANSAVFQAFLKPNDTVLGMSLSHGGHLTHGSKVSFSGKIYNSVEYKTDKQGEIDYDQVKELALLHKPKMIIAGFSAYSKIINWQKFRQIADQVGAYLLADMAHVAGFVATGLYPNPLEYAHAVTSTTHKTLAGPRGGIILSNAKDETVYKKLNSAVFPGQQGGPLCHVIAAKAVAFKEALEPQFKEYQKQVLKNAKAMVDVFKDRTYKIVGSTTQNHMFLVDLIDKNITGKDADLALGFANITVNKNSVPNDPKSPFVTSGLRLGTPAITRRGIKEDDAKLIATWICDILDDLANIEMQKFVKAKTIELLAKFPVYK